MAFERGMKQAKPTRGKAADGKAPNTKLGASKPWDFWIDRGGTFTDIVGRRPDGQLVAHKLL